MAVGETYSVTYDVTSYDSGSRKDVVTYGVTSYGSGSRKDVVTSYGSGWKKDVVTLWRNQLWQWVEEGCRNPVS